MPDDPLVMLFGILTDMMTTYGNVFEDIGLSIYGSLVLLAIGRFALNVMDSGFDRQKATGLFFSISFGFVMLRFYTHPWPVIGMSFAGMLQHFGTDFANHLNAAMVDHVMTGLNQSWRYVSSQSFYTVWSPTVLMAWGLLVITLLFAKGCLFFSIAFGYIALSIGILVGPVFICWWIFPEMNWMFWGWLKAVLQFSFYGVMANAVVFVLGSLLLGYMGLFGADYSAAKITVATIGIAPILMAFSAAVLVVPPILTSAFFSGHTGHVNVSAKHFGGRS